METFKEILQFPDLYKYKKKSLIKLSNKSRKHRKMSELYSFFFSIYFQFRIQNRRKNLSILSGNENREKEEKKRFILH